MKKLIKSLLTTRQFISIRFMMRLGRKVNLKNPIKYNDKLQWLKLNWQDTLAMKAADKFEVRELVSDIIGSQYLNDVYAVYDSVQEIDLSELPKSFVLKGTHGSGFNIVCQDKSKINWDEKFEEMDKWLKTDYFLETREPVYQNIKPRIICEKFLTQSNNEELIDYRFFCFNGKTKFISVDFSINDKSKTRRNLYDLEWNLLEEEISYPRNPSIDLEKPQKLNEMIELSNKLSKPFPHARIDFYYIDNKILFGEITFFHQSGYAVIQPEEFEIMMGNWLELPKAI